MKMKSWKFLFTGLGSIVCGLLLFTACGETGNGQSGNNPPVKEHTAHEWSESYIESGDRHYQTCKGCEEKKYGEHDFTNGDCVCGKAKPVETHTHSMTEHKRVEPTCTAEGNVLYYSCSGCNKNFSDKDGETELKEIGLPANGHSMTEHKRVEPTCTAEGNVLYYSCSDCNKNFSDKDGDTELKEIGLPANGHSMTEHKRVEPTCAAGNVFYYSCSGCNKNFSDKDGQTELKEITIPATGLHVWDDNVCTICKHDVGGSKGLKWELSADKSSYTVAGIGVCEDTEITIPQTYNGLPVTEIGDHAFDYCETLTGISLPDGLEKIGTDAFFYCTQLVGIEIPESVADIADRSFFGCASLTSVGLSDRIERIGEGTFSNCELLGKIVLPNQLKSIGEEAFMNCVSMSAPDIPDTVTSIGKGAFTCCFSVTKMKLPSGITAISDSIFSNCKALSSVEFPSGIVSIGVSAFQDCAALGEIAIPDSVTSIGNNAFAGCRALRGIVIPDKVTSIGDRAFQSCILLSDIVIPDSVTNIGIGAFADCSALERITIPFIGAKKDGTAESHFGYIFGAARANGVLGNADCVPETLKTVVLTGGDSIPVQAFRDCAIVSFSLPSSLKRIEEWAFLNCTALTGITIPSGVEKIGEEAFRGCSLITEMTIPEGVTDIERYAFSDCTSIRSVTIPKSAVRIGYAPFSSCHNLTEITVRAGNPIYHSSGNCIIETESKTLIAGCNGSTIPADGSVTAIGEVAFADCTAFTEIVIPNCIARIGGSAFSSCASLTKVVIPDSVKYAERNSFNYCDALTVYCEAMEAPSEWQENWNGDAPVVWDCENNRKDRVGYEYAVVDGIRYSFKDGKATVIRQPKSVKGAVRIPTSVIYNGEEYFVTEITERAFMHCIYLTDVYLPDTLTEFGSMTFFGDVALASMVIPKSVDKIGAGSFLWCSLLKEVFYMGTEEERNSITVESNNENLTSATWYYYSETEPTEEGNYWHYDSDGVTPVKW